MYIFIYSHIIVTPLVAWQQVAYILSANLSKSIYNIAAKQRSASDRRASIRYSASAIRSLCQLSSTH